MRTNATYNEVVQRREVVVKCLICGKKLRRVLKKSYYLNGLHDPAKTEAANNRALDREAAKLAKGGMLCASCDSKADS